MNINIVILNIRLLSISLSKHGFSICMLSNRDNAGIYVHLSKHLKTFSIFGYLFKVELIKNVVSIYILGCNISIDTENKKAKIKNLFLKKKSDTEFYFLSLTIYVYKKQIGVAFTDRYKDFNIIYFAL